MMTATMSTGLCGVGELTGWDFTHTSLLLLVFFFIFTEEDYFIPPRVGLVFSNMMCFCVCMCAQIKLRHTEDRHPKTSKDQKVELGWSGLGDSLGWLGLM